jgi:thimet oligopeptidase
MNGCTKNIIWIVTFLIIMPACFYQTKTIPDFTAIQTTEQLEALFPKTPQEIHDLSSSAMSDAAKHVQSILALETGSRTFANTALALDRMAAHFEIKVRRIYLLTLVSPELSLRNAAQEQLILLQNFAIDTFSQNKELYKAFVDYAKQSALSGEYLTPEQKYYVTKTLESFEHSGLNEPEEVQKQIKKIEKELAIHSLNFDKNIASSNITIAVTAEQLAGLDAEFIANLKRGQDDSYILGTDYPTYSKVMADCSVGETRKALWRAYATRAYPANKAELETIIALRDQLAKLLGRKSYADLDIEEQMAKTPEHVEAFLQNLINRCEQKVKQEIDAIKADLPQSISLSPDGKLYPWDLAYIENYRKKKLDVDESAIAEYFPLEHTLSGLLAIYQKFFGLSFNTVKISKDSFWHNDVQLLAVYKNGQFIGSVLLDLFPREDKYTHFCELAIMRHIQTGNTIIPAVVTVIANFPTAQHNKPALLKRSDVITFFHEFGHAIHDLLGATQLYSQAGTHVKGDFVEMPSQMLEEWMWNPSILKQLSKHYVTGESLPDDLIEKIIKLKNLSTGDDTQRQIFFAFMSLNYFKDGAHKDVHAMWKNLSQVLRPHMFYDDQSYSYCSFGHLVGYGAKYYGYLWSKVFALDLFDHIKQVGLLDNCMGTKYTREVIGRGGSRDPEESLKEFLGREPKSDAFFANIGV